MVQRLPRDWFETLDLPLIAAPMFLVSRVDLVAVACENGVVGAIPTVNAREPDILEGWLDTLTRRLARPLPRGRRAAPWALSLIVHTSNKRLPADLALCSKYKAPLVLT